MAEAEDAHAGARRRVRPAARGRRSQIARATEEAAVSAFHTGMGISAALVGFGGLLGLALVRTPRRDVSCAGCPGGQLAGAPVEAARERAPVPAAA